MVCYSRKIRFVIKKIEKNENYQMQVVSSKRILRNHSCMGDCRKRGITNHGKGCQSREYSRTTTTGNVYRILHLWYGLEFLIRLLQYRNWNDAYMNVSFEREAYANEDNMNYLNERYNFSWTDYLRKKE